MRTQNLSIPVLHRLLLLFGILVYLLTPSMGHADEISQDNSTFVFTKGPDHKNQGWFSSDSNYEADPRLFDKRAKERFRELDGQLLRLRYQLQIRPQDEPTRKKLKELKEIGSKLKQAKKAQKIYRAAGEDTAGEKRTAFETAMTEIERGLLDKTGEVLSEKDAKEWKMESTLADHQYQLAQLKKAAKQDLPGEEKAILLKKIQILENHTKVFAEKTNAVKEAKEGERESLEKDIESELAGFDKDYLKAVHRLKKPDNQVLMVEE